MSYGTVVSHDTTCGSVLRLIRNARTSIVQYLASICGSRTNAMSSSVYRSISKTVESRRQRRVVFYSRVKGKQIQKPERPRSLSIRTIVKPAFAVRLGIYICTRRHVPYTAVIDGKSTSYGYVFR